MKACVASLLWFIATQALAADLTLTQEGQPRAEIVIAAAPLRSVRLAAQELQDYVEKVSGAHLPIVTQPSGSAPVQLFVGRSAGTDKLKLSDADLKDGAYRMVSGDHWLALIGQDTEFTPIEPWARNNAEITSGKAQTAWNQITGAAWGVPNLLIYKDRFTLPGTTGLPDAQRAGAKLPPLESWGFDERGSYNAVCGFLQKLGVRWYAPGDAGEVLPKQPTITLAPLDETIRPDFPMRRWNVRFGVHGPTLARWAMRLGIRDPYPYQCAHGMDQMTQQREILANHPDWFALYGGKRQNQPGQVLNQLCYSNEELFRETVRNVRLQFDHFKFEAVSVMPPDGYTAICQCPLCAGKDSPERGSRGSLSDYVWDFVNRVAREVRKTHPDKKVLNCAYGAYTLPPEKIDKLEPNVLVSIVGGRRPCNNTPAEQEEYAKLREAWLKKTDNPIINFENYPFTDRGWYLPSFTPHTMGASINALKGVSLGEDIWLSVRQDFEKEGLGFNHFLVYFTQRMYWGGKEQNVDAIFREYCRLFYGPAEKEMLAFFDYCEANWQAMEKDKAKADTALTLFATAKAQVEPASVYGQRIGWIDAYLKGLRNKSTQLGRQRGPVPVLRLVGESRSKIVLDGKLDDEAWQTCPVASTGRLRELETGRVPIFGTTVKSLWRGNDLYFAIRCDEHPGEKPNIGTTRHDDPALWYGDAVELLIETEARSYYQIAISPSGAIADMDRSAGRDSWLTWNSQAEVATQIADDHWTAEIRIPVTADENDPLHQVIGHKPTRSLPWHINICRQRIRDDGQEYSAFSPTAGPTFHNPMKFATFYDGLSYEFEHGPADLDFLEVSRLASELAQKGRLTDAIAAYADFAAKKTTDIQQSAALSQAAALAKRADKSDQAQEFIARIPIEAVRKCAIMQALLDRAQSKEVVTQFGTEPIEKWPFWKRGEGYTLRGRALAAQKSGREAENDFTKALEWTSEPRLRDGIQLALAQNRETAMQDEAGALAAYHAVIDSAKQLGSADQFYAVQGIARLLTKQRKFDEAMAALDRANSNQLQGFWKTSMLLSNAEVQAAAGRRDQARATYESIVSDAKSDPRLRKVAEEKLAKL